MIVKRYGRRLVIFTPRVWKWKLGVWVDPLPSVCLLGALAYRDDEDGDWWLRLGVGLLEIRISPQRMWTKREQKQREDEYVAQYGSRLVEEVEEHLRGSH